ncbi:MAG: ArsR/SmtB family transcription factor [Candidatus Dormibacteraceae bacterium]
MDAVLRALAEPHRREILRLVWGTELTAGEIAAHFPVTRSAISQHLAFLKESALLGERRVGTRRYYRALPRGLAELRGFLEEFRDDRLASLRRAELEERKKRDEG